MHTILCLIFSYLMGSISTALIIGKVFYNKDVRNYGSKNLGASNTGRVLGKVPGFTVIVLDHIKTMIAIALVTLYTKHFNPDYLLITIYLSAICVVIGHCYPIFANFRGGKSVACTFGILLITNIYLFIITVALFVTILKLTKFVSLSSMTVFFVSTILSFIPVFRYSPLLDVHFDIFYSLLILGLATFIVIKHKSNIKRLQQGTENKIKWMK